MRISNSCRTIVRTGAIVLAAVCAACGSTAPVVEVADQPVPTSATIALAESELVYDSDADFSPSGNARVAPTDGGWCLEDASGVRCVDALAEESASHGIVWRQDETAIAVTWGAQNPISIIDFDAGTSVEASLSTHRILGWDGEGQIIGLDIEWPEKELLRMNPTTLEPEVFAPLDTGGVPQLVAIGEDRFWGSTPGAAEVFTITAGSEPEVIEGGLGEQLITSISADGRYAVTLDNARARGRGESEDPSIWLFDAQEQRSAGILVPDRYNPESINHLQLAADGGAMLAVLYTTDRQYELVVATIDPSTLAATDWTVLIDADAVDIDGSTEAALASGYVSNQRLYWSGGDTAWFHADDGNLYEITLGIAS